MNHLIQDRSRKLVERIVWNNECRFQEGARDRLPDRRVPGHEARFGDSSLDVMLGGKCEDLILGFALQSATRISLS